MIKYIYVCVFWVVVMSCLNKQKETTKNNVQTKGDKKVMDLEVNQLTLTHLPNDTTEIHVEFGATSGDFTVFFFKIIPKNYYNSITKTWCLFAEYKASENKKKALILAKG